MDITDKLKELAGKRDVLERCKNDVLYWKQELEKTSEWIVFQKTLDLQKRFSIEMEELEKEIRDIAVQIFDGQNKKPVHGIEIKEFSVIKVLDEKKALIWASQNAPSILKLDQTKFKKAVENLELDFVEKSVEYRGQIASDLSEYLK